MQSVAVRGGHGQSGRQGQHLVALIDPNRPQRELIAQALVSFYRVAEYSDIETALGTLGCVPSLVIVDEKVIPANKRPLMRVLKADPVTTGVPVLQCVSRGRQLTGDPPDCTLEKPFRRSELINAVSGLLNQSVEAEWQKLPPRPQAALKETLATYNGIADLIERGEPLSQEQLEKACAPLIEAVAASEHKEMLKAVRRHDNYGYVHAVRVATLLTLFGITIGLNEDALVLLACGGMVHDIGKMTIPFEVLNKQGELSEEERGLVRGHVDRTVEFLKKRPALPKGVITIAAQHHERLDGSGYPLGLKADALNDLARMAAIVDVFVAQTDRRAYKSETSPETAIAVMMEDMAEALDQALVRRFRKMLLDSAAQNWA